MLRLPRLPEHNEGGAERYLITYADMITLLLVLFIILYATANQDLEKFKALSQSLAEGFGAQAPEVKVTSEGGTPIADKSAGGTKPVEMFPENQVPVQVFDFERELRSDNGQQGELIKEIKEVLQQAAQQAGLDTEGLKADVVVDFNERGIRISIFPDQILFDSGSAQLKPAFMEILNKLEAPLAKLPNQIEVQGHTDNQPISTAAFPSNWELSAGRAGAVVRYFEKLGLPGNRLAAAGYADTRPIDTNATAAGRARNRRVEIIILRSNSAGSNSGNASSSSSGSGSTGQGGGSPPAGATPPAEATPPAVAPAPPAPDSGGPAVDTP
jgi:chemotaxis protein MotB